MATQAEQDVARIIGARVVAGDASGSATPETAKVVVGSPSRTVEAFEAKLTATLNAK